MSNIIAYTDEWKEDVIYDIPDRGPTPTPTIDKNTGEMEEACTNFFCSNTTVAGIIGLGSIILPKVCFECKVPPCYSRNYMCFDGYCFYCYFPSMEKETSLQSKCSVYNGFNVGPNLF